MRIDEKTFQSMPAELKAIFYKLPNPGKDEVLAGFPETKNAYPGRQDLADAYAGTRLLEGNGFTNFDSSKAGRSLSDSGSAAHFFYCAKSSKSERTHKGQVENKHPTVKPLALMHYLVKLITPPGGTILDPFTGSGSTLVAATDEGFNCIGIELDLESVETSIQRLSCAPIQKECNPGGTKCLKP